MNRFLGFVLVLGILSTTCFAQDLEWKQLNNYLDTLEAHNKFMGSLAVSKNGTIVFTRTMGMTDVELNQKANDDSKYRIGSISKTFTAVLVFKAVEQGLIDLSETIEGHFPTIENSDKITVEHLLHHRSGIHNFTNDEAFLTWHTEKKTEDELLEIIAKAGSDFEPGSKMAYSNSNYVLLTILLERRFKKSYADLLAEYITQPLGLENTWLGGPVNPQNNEARSYFIQEKWSLAPESDMSIPLGAGGIVSTASDLVKFSDALFGGQLLSDASLERMTALQDNYGAGLFPIPFYELKGFGHSGGIDGFSSVFSHFSEGEVSYALISNGSNFKNNDISIAVLSAVYGRPFSIPEFKVLKMDSSVLEQYLGVYASSEIPLKITITKGKKSLMAQATGQPSFPLEPVEKNVFKFDVAGVVMEFDPSKNTMVLKQGGGQFNYKKE